MRGWRSSAAANQPLQRQCSVSRSCSVCAGRAIARQEIRIVLNPKGSNRVGPQTVIDVPAPRVPGSIAQVGSSFFLSGWAADLDSTWDRGVDTVHVWAYPADGRAPIFLGVASSGNARPDVGALYGNQFEGSSFDLTVAGLKRGLYDLVVYPHRAATGAFEGAQVVRIFVQ